MNSINNFPKKKKERRKAGKEKPEENGNKAFVWVECFFDCMQGRGGGEEVVRWREGVGSTIKRRAKMA